MSGVTWAGASMWKTDGVDLAVVERILGGDWRLNSTPAEKAEVCRRWVASGRALADLSRLTGWATHRYYRSQGVAS